ncbi:MAG: hypothetical protein DI539_21200 [Flavobacterium psychrophilum]|jgi:CheY-like chemotaxis protein|nr:MAG: hypothetical protein DI539_21200 [Flavobacterium psychrophilum]
MLKQLIHIELENLLSLLGDDRKKVGEMVRVFMDETPTHFEEIRKHIQDGNLKEASELVHKVKTRYGYIGLDGVTEELTNWESELSMKNKMDHTLTIGRFEQINEEIIAELKVSRFYIPPIEKMNDAFPLAGKLVLVAEDDEINAMVFELFIKENGATVLIANDGNQAIKLALEKSPDMIFMDVHMPFFSGLDAIRELRNRGLTCPIISLSASTRLDERKNSIEAGANDFLIKPAKRESIKKALFTYLNA